MCSLKMDQSQSYAAPTHMDFLPLKNFAASDLESSKLQVTKRIEQANLTIASVKRVKPEKDFESL
jgi:hypothetical protein